MSERYQEMSWDGLLGSDDQSDEHALAGWDEHVVKEFGAFVPELGYLSNDDGRMPPVEVTEDDIQTSGFGGYFRTPVLEMSPDDIAAYKNTGEVPDGALALGDDGTIYQYSGLDGFFKKLFKRVRKGIKKIRGKIRKAVRKLLKRTKFGRIILKVRDKIVKVMMKIVKPLMKFVGKWAGKIAPIAAMIPGYGTVIAGALTVAGKIAKIYNKTNAVMKDVISPPDKKGGKEVHHKKIFFKTKKHEAMFHKLLKAEADEMKKRPKSELEAMNAKLKAMPVEKYSKPTAVNDEEAERMVNVMKRARGALRPGRGISRKSALPASRMVGKIRSAA